VNRVWFALFKAVIASPTWSSVAIFFKDCQKYFKGLPDKIKAEDLILIGCHFGIVSYSANDSVEDERIGIISESSDDSTTKESSVWSPMGRILRSMSDQLSKAHIPIEHIAQISVSKIVEAQESRTPVKAFEGIFDHSNFPGVDERTFQLLKMRHLAEKAATLEAVGNQLDLTKERVRQLERKFFRDFDDGCLDSNLYTNLFGWILTDLFDRRGSIILGSVSEIDEHRKFAARGLGLPITKLGNCDISVLGPLNFPKPTFDLDYFDSHDITKFFDRREIYLNLRSLFSNDLIEEDIFYIAEHLYATRLLRARKGLKIVVALISIGQASHYSEITTAYNDIFTDDNSSERSIHGALGRQQYGVVHIGQKGTFGLTQWGDSRPEQGLYELATEIAKFQYLQTNQPVLLETIKEEIEKVRSLNDASLPFITGANKDLRVVLGPAFVPVEAVEIARISDQVAGSRALTNYCFIDFSGNLNWINDLAAKFIAGPEITGKNLTNFLNLDRSINIGNLHAYVHYGIGPAVLSDILNSHGRLEQIHNAIKRFELNFKNWGQFKGREPNRSWLIPDCHIDVNHNIDRTTETSIEEWANEIGSTELQTLLRNGSFLEEWAHLLSLDILEIAGRFRAGDRISMVRMFINFAHELTEEVGVEGPWDSRLDKRFQGLSIYSLYQFRSEPDPRLDTLFRRLINAGCSNVGHLAIFQPDIWAAIDRVPFEAWIRLYVKLNQS